MAPNPPKVLQFPVRNPYIPARSQDSLARDLRVYDTQRHASRIAQQVEQEIAHQAARMSTGARASRVRPVLTMPASILVTPSPSLPRGGFAQVLAMVKKLAGRS